MNDWHVIVTREGRDWLAEVEGLRGGAHTYARTLDGLDKSVREVIILGADLPDEALDSLEITYEYRLPEADDGDRRRAVEKRDQGRRLTQEAEQISERLARSYVAHGVAVRDVAKLLNISHQRVSQLTAPTGQGKSRESKSLEWPTQPKKSSKSPRKVA